MEVANLERNVSILSQTRKLGRWLHKVGPLIVGYGKIEKIVKISRKVLEDFLNDCFWVFDDLTSISFVA